MSSASLDPQEEREAAVREWEKQTHTSLVANGRRKKLSGIAIATGAAALLVTFWYVKQSAGDPVMPAANLSIPERKPVPKLKGQEPETTATPAMISAQPTDDPMRVQREQMEMQRQEQQRRMLEARMKSGLIAPNTQNTAAALPPGMDSLEPATAPVLGGGSAERGAQDQNSRFARAVSGGGVPVSKASQVGHLPYKILQGKLIEAVLEPRATSDLPGMLCATVQRDIYGAQERNTLIPWGSRICGVYSADVRKGQDRLFVIWNMLRRPDGVQVALDSAGADQLGTAGMGGHVDTHFAQVFGMSALLSIIGAGASNMGVGSTDQYNSAAAYRQSVQQAAAQTSQSVLQPYIATPPTIAVPPGSRVRIYVNRDLDFSPIYEDEIMAVQRWDAVEFIQ
ncbi:TrbI/VirB10 family protein [Comamonas antarctica]|uniref:TrbI/VirB10 family protein n=1 Tax=Comamonas antarctica TaxID=2743470 RepID=A0A6N1X8J1_9BURK|nr:TrbI/VirB10 family protein [Comamonas antarctica]QKV55689.1 TrbI/VirB10 family protein [Comamonas antarctica]